MKSRPTDPAGIERKSGPSKEVIYDPFGFSTVFNVSLSTASQMYTNSAAQDKTSSYPFFCPPTGNTWVISDKQLQLGDIPEIISFLRSHPEITSLDLNNNPLDKEFIQDLSEKLPATVKSLDLTRCGINDNSAIILSKNTNFTELFLGNNNITDIGANALSTQPKLSVLYLNNNEITDKGLNSFGSSTTLISFNIFCNKITNAGAKILLQNRSIVGSFRFVCGVNNKENQIDPEHQKHLSMLVEKNKDLNLAKEEMRKTFRENRLLIPDLANIVAEHMSYDLPEEKPLPNAQADTSNAQIDRSASEQLSSTRPAR